MGSICDVRGKEDMLVDGFPFRFFSYSEAGVKKLFGLASDMGRNKVERRLT